SRRTFFYYFKSKDEILAAQLDSYADALKISLVENSSAGTPYEIVRDTLVQLATRFESSQMIAIARLMRDNEASSSGTQARYGRLEQPIYETLCELWPTKRRRDGLRLVAIASISTLRLAVDNWLQQSGKRPLAKYIQDAFDMLKAELSEAG